MLLSLALIFLCGMALGSVFTKIKLPPLLGMLLTGIVLGPYALGLLDESILTISADLRKIALVIILTRAGLNLNFADLKRVGRPAVLMCFVPACFEIIGMVLLAPRFLGITILEAAIMGSVAAAVSPAVIVPKMLKLAEEGYGRQNSIPQMIMAGASVDDVFVIVLFTSFTGLAKTGNFSAADFIRIPISIFLGVIGGLLCGLMLYGLFNRAKIRDSAKVLITLSISFLLCVMEELQGGIWGFSGLIAVMSIGMTIGRKNPPLAARLSSKYAKLWVPAELLLFVLVGASVNITYAAKAGITVISLIMLVLLFRMLGVFLCMFKTKLTPGETLFCMIAYCPKATVQAAIGSIPLSMGLACGDMVLTVAVLSILITAPLGAFAIDCLYKKLLLR